MEDITRSAKMSFCGQLTRSSCDELNDKNNIDEEDGLAIKDRTPIFHPSRLRGHEGRYVIQRSQLGNEEAS